MKNILIAVLLLVVSGCASGPTYRADQDPTADFSQYRTYAFMEELGTDKAGYSSLITQHFKTAISREMQALGYTMDERAPDLLVNFSATSRERSEVRSRPTTTMSVGYGYGYYGYRGGLYGTYPLYGTEVDTVTYRTGTANIDVVDADRKMLLWEGVAEGRLTDKALQNPKQAIDTVVAELFKRYPTAKN